MLACSEYASTARPLSGGGPLRVHTPHQLNDVANRPHQINRSVAVSLISETALDRHFGARYELSTRM